MTEELVKVIYLLEGAAKRFREMGEKADAILKDPKINGHLQELIERAQVIIELEQKVLYFFPNLDKKEKKLLKKSLAGFSTKARQAIELENTYQLVMLLDYPENKNGGKNDLEKLIDSIRQG